MEQDGKIMHRWNKVVTAMAPPVTQNCLTSPSCKLPLLVHELCLIRHFSLVMKACPTIYLAPFSVCNLPFLMQKMWYFLVHILLTEACPTLTKHLLVYAYTADLQAARLYTV